MKYLFIYLFIIIPLWSYSQFDVQYDFATNMVSVDYNPCSDPCRYLCEDGTFDEDIAREMVICNCNQSCETQFQDCIQTCRDNFTGLTQFSMCVEGCQRNSISICQDRCIDGDGPKMELISYNYTLIAAYAPIPMDPRFAPENQMISDDFGPFTSDNVEIPDWVVPSPWPGIATGNNSCYGIQVTARYRSLNNPSIVFECEYAIEWTCFFLG